MIGGSRFKQRVRAKSSHRTKPNITNTVSPGREERTLHFQCLDSSSKLKAPLSRSRAQLLSVRSTYWSSLSSFPNNFETQGPEMCGINSVVGNSTNSQRPQRESGYKLLVRNPARLSRETPSLTRDLQYGAHGEPHVNRNCRLWHAGQLPRRLPPRWQR